MKSIARLTATVVFGLAVLVGPASACLNTFQSRILHGNSFEVASALAKLESDFQRDPSLEHTNDLAVGRVLARRYAEAIELLHDADKRFPGKAIVAANLGTAYELAGDNDEALRWISEGVKRDPKEHYGSEWLHVKILEAKIALAKDPEWLHTHTVLGVSFGSEPEPKMQGELPLDESGAPRSVSNVVLSIDYQMWERRKFVDPPDAVMAELYSVAGDLVWIAMEAKTWDGPPREPWSYYGEAREYAGQPTPQLLRVRLARLNVKHPGGSAVERSPGAWASSFDGRAWILSVVLLLIAVGLGAYRKLKKP